MNLSGPPSAVDEIDCASSAHVGTVSVIARGMSGDGTADMIAAMVDGV
jgi:hypothetical protein